MINMEKKTILQMKLEKNLNRRIVYFIFCFFKEQKIKPTMDNVLKITESQLQQSWLSVPSMKELMLYQQEQIK